jgi:hypothetical protein
MFLSIRRLRAMQYGITININRSSILRDEKEDSPNIVHNYIAGFLSDIFAREIPFYQVQPCQSGFSFPSQS